MGVQQVQQSRASDRRPLVLLTVVFIASRVAYSMLGVHFDASNLTWSTNLAAVSLLRHHLLQTVWYMHTEPPGFNLLVGLVLKWSPLSATTSLHAVWLGFGFALVLGLYDLGRQLHVGRWTAVVAAMVIGCGPTAVLYENTLNYDYLVAVLLVLLVDAVARWVRTGRAATLAAVAACAAAATLTRALLHPIWLVAILVIVLVARRPDRWTWKPIAAVAAAVLVVAVFVTKDAVLFGSPQLSSLFGYNVWRVSVGTLSDRDQHRLRAERVLRAPGQPKSCHVSHPEVPVLAQKYKPGTSFLNSNWECMLGWYDELEGDAFRAAKAQPGRAMSGVAGSFELWAAPSDLYPDKNRTKISGLDTAYRRIVQLDLVWNPPVALPRDHPPPPEHRHHVALTVVLATIIDVVGAGLVLVVMRRKGVTPARVATLVGGATVVFVTLASNLFEHGENPRIRYIVEPLTLMLAVALVAAFIRHRRARGRRSSDGQVPGVGVPESDRRRPSPETLGST